MSGDRLRPALRQIERLFGSGTVAGLGEGPLLDRFLDGRDEVAFEALVARHGPMVLGVCRRLLRDPDAVEDAFQATFLILVRKARTIRDRELLGHWLYGVARRVAVRARIQEALRTARPSLSDLPEPADGASPGLRAERDELRDVLDEELSRLPESFRAPIVLCHLEGLTHEQAAERLRWPVGTVRSRMARGRAKLRDRLARRGIAPAILASGGWFGTESATAAVPIPLVESTVRAAMALITSSKLIAYGTTSAGAVALARGALDAMMLSKLKLLGMTALVAAGVVGGGMGVAARQDGGASVVRGAASLPAEEATKPIGPSAAGSDDRPNEPRVFDSNFTKLQEQKRIARDLTKPQEKAPGPADTEPSDLRAQFAYENYASAQRIRMETRNQILQAEADLEYYEQKLKEMQVQIGSAKERIRRLQLYDNTLKSDMEEYKEAKSALAAPPAEASPPKVPTTDAPWALGRVRAVDKYRNVVEIDIGQDDGLTPRNTLGVFRFVNDVGSMTGQPQNLNLILVGKILLTSVDPDRSVGNIVEQTPAGGGVQVGDRVLRQSLGTPAAEGTGILDERPDQLASGMRRGIDVKARTARSAPPVPEARSPVASTGTVLVMPPRATGQISAYSVQNGGWRTLELPEGITAEARVQGEVVALRLEGPVIRQVAVFIGGNWFPITLKEPAQEVVDPLISERAVVYDVGRRIYAFSPPAGKWGVLELEEGVDHDKPSFAEWYVSVEAGGRFHVFNAMTGTWSSVDAKGNPSEANAATDEAPTTAQPKPGPPSIERHGSVLVSLAEDGSRITVYNLSLDTKTTYRAPEGTKILAPVYSDTVIALQLEGPKIRELAVYNLSGSIRGQPAPAPDGDPQPTPWSIYKLKEPASGKIEPIVGSRSVVIPAGKEVVAYATNLDQWDSVQLRSDPPPQLKMDGQTFSIVDGSLYHILNTITGKWRTIDMEREDSGDFQHDPSKP
jgi:RNA polymerase sigma factor (sigma-70 family)